MSRKALLGSDSVAEKNLFGGGNPHSIYVPMSEDEQEVMERLIMSGELEIVAAGHGICQPQKVIWGDLRLTLFFQVMFGGSDMPRPLHFLDLELRTKSGHIKLFEKHYATIGSDGQPLHVANGIFLELAWDIAIDHMDPALVKMVKPGAIGMTSRRLDRDTKERTVQGNMRLDPIQQRILHAIEESTAKVRRYDQEDVEKAVKKDAAQ